VTTRRLLKAAEAIREVVSMAILTELRDPRVQNVTVTGVDVAPDMKEAKVRVSVMGTESQQKLTIRGLENSAGFLQAKIAKKIVTRYTPRLHFELDDGVKKSIALAQLLHQIEEERRAANPEPSPDEDEEPDDELDVDSATDQSELDDHRDQD
jgi:ribosome-binding factor A